MGQLRRFRRCPLSREEGRFAADCLLAIPVAERSEKAREFFLDDPEMVLPLLSVLEERKDGSPSSVREDAEFLFRFLEKETRGPEDGGLFLFDEREYLMGESARIAATTCRYLSLRDEARRWIDRSEAAFRRTLNSAPHLSRVAYQRLALYTEERRFDEVLELLPGLVESFEREEMPEDALKCRFLEGAVLIETNQLTEAVAVFTAICEKAAALRSEKLVATASYNLVQVYADLGQAEEAMAKARETVPLLQRLGDRIGLAKLQWGIGDMLRIEGERARQIGDDRGQLSLGSAIESYRVAQKEFRDLGMQADVAALHLVIADLLLDVGQDRQARWEIQAALPVIEEYGLVPEGVAALSLLRESLNNHRINRQALRDLHGYFPLESG